MAGMSDRQQTYLLETGNGSYLRLSAMAYFVLTRIDSGSAADEVAQDLSHQLGRVVTAAHVDAAYAQVRQRIDAITQQPRRPKPFGLWLRIRLLPISAVGCLSRHLSRLFHPAAAAPLALFTALAAILTLTAGAPVRQNMMDPGASFLPLLGLFMVSMLAHELGHASASMRYGVPARDIGIGLYVIYPVFYSDVTGAWELTRRQRVVIDLAGVFFQFFVGAVYLVIYRLTGWEIFSLAAASVFFLGLFTLLPIFKFDGYWLLTDLLGVVNLSRQVRKVAVHVLDRLRRGPGTRLPWPTWVSVSVLIYGALTVAYLVLFTVNLALALPDLAAQYPARVVGLLRDLYLPPHTPAAGRVASVLGPTYILLGVGLAAATLSRRLIQARRPS
ncbi:hypothetical protein ACFLIM_36130 [Nonomuraea sp. M3C6]|uniref:Peptide zinc metalloprotease protein n=1 Tax=Nonomuraea marmarensis TaxID=3351344 RepID=A0ABW7ANM6_9ACTN